MGESPLQLRSEWSAVCTTPKMLPVSNTGQGEVVKLNIRQMLPLLDSIHMYDHVLALLVLVSIVK